MQSKIGVDVLCVGHASYDLVFSVSVHPQEDEKVVANGFLSCGGGPAANAAVAVSRLGFKSAFAGYLGQDVFGEIHKQELIAEDVYSDLIVRGDLPTPLSAVVVKPDGKRALINYKSDTKALSRDATDFALIEPKAVLFDGHEPNLSLAILDNASHDVVSVLDAGSVHEGTLALMKRVDFLVCSEKFALQYANDENSALNLMAEFSPCVVITLGERGLIWRRGQERGIMPAFSVDAIDTTGAGDAFHGAFSAAVAAGMGWDELLRYASAAGSLCCTKMGARQGMPLKKELVDLLAKI